MAKKLLEELPTGGKTPLGLGLLTSYQLVKSQLRKDQGALPLVVIITDGQANAGIDRHGYYEGTRSNEIYKEINKVCRLFRNEEKIHTLVIDAEEKHYGSFDRARELAKTLNAKYYLLEDIISFNIIKTVKQEMASTKA
jgi:magnesium chelatase subunit D